MHELNRTLRESTSGRPRTTRHLFAFAGVGFEVLADESVQWEVPENYGFHLAALGSMPVFADVICSLSVDRSLPQRQLLERAGAPSNALHLERERGRTTVIAADLRAEFSEIGLGRYVATAHISVGPAGVAALLLGLSSALVQAQGGLNLHAAAVEYRGEALLFVGPSGAGKSTAALLTAAPVFAYDRVSVIVSGGQALALSLPGGTPIPGERSTQRCLPIAACLRVRRGTPRPELRTLDGAARLFAIRESVEVSSLTLGDEEQHLQRAALLSAQVPVLDLYTVLGEPLSGLFDQGLAFSPATGETARYVVID